MTDPANEERFRAALAAQQSGRLEDAKAGYLAVLSETPEHRSSWINLGVILRQQKLYPAAIAAQRKALGVRPDLAAPEDRDMADHFAAERWADAFALLGQNRPDIETAAENLASLLAGAGRHEEALPLFRELLAFRGTTERVAGLAATLRALNRHGEALALIERRGDPLTPRLHMERAWSRLTLGDWRGFRDFEYRFDTDFAQAPKIPLPTLDRAPKPTDRLCVIGDQGLGDTIWSLRFLSALKASGAQVTLALPPPLLRLFQEVPGADDVAPLQRLKGQFHAVVYTSSLPVLTGFETGPPPPPVAVRVPPDSHQRAARRTAAWASRRRIGICWTGNPAFAANHRRSLRPEAFAALASLPNTQLFSLYKGPDREALTTSGMAGLIVDLCGDDRDMGDTAAAIEAMDLVISTDTAVLHLAGSLNTPTWAVLPHEGFWYWGDGETSPWYKKTRLYRQAGPDDWANVFSRMRRDLTSGRALSDD